MSSCHTPSTPQQRQLRLRRLGFALALALAGWSHAGAQTATAASSAASFSPAAAGAANVQLWHGAARDAIARTKPNQQAALRLLAYLSLAQHEAVQAVGPTIANEAAWAAALDRASAELLSSMLPGLQPVWEGLAASLAAARGEDDPAVAAVLAQAKSLATDAARRVVSRAAADGFDAAWSGAAPDSAHAWKSQMQPPRAPHLPQLGSMKPIFLATADALRAPPPPQPGDAAFAAGLAEVRQRVNAGGAAGVARAKRWEMTGGSLVAGFWDESAAELARSAGLSGPETARVLALVLGATMDANIACHRVKYTYWVPRPSQVDASIKTVVGLPNHPSYPSNHSCDSMAAATVLANLFPRHKPALEAMAREAGESRIDGGIHYRFDVEAGEAIGRGAAAAALRAGGKLTVAERP